MVAQRNAAPGLSADRVARLRSLEAIEQEKIQLTVKTVDDQLMRRVEPGTFTMGSSRAEQGRRANEVLVPVTLTRPFLIGCTRGDQQGVCQVQAWP